MKKSVILSLFCILIGNPLLWDEDVFSYHKSFNKIPIESVEAQMGFNVEESMNEAKTSSLENGKNTDQFEKQLNSMLVKQTHLRLKDFGLVLWNLALKPMLFLIFLYRYSNLAIPNYQKED